MTLGQKLRNFRKRSGLSQLELEAEVGASSGTISRIENGEVNPTKETILRIASTLKLTNHELDYLIGSFADPVSQEEIEEAKRDVEEYFSKRGMLAYLVDDRWRIWKVSPLLVKFLGVSSEQFDKAIGKTVIELIVDENYGVVKNMSEEKYEDLLRNQLTYYHSDVNFTKGESIYENTVTAIKNNSISARIWKEVTEKNTSVLHMSPDISTAYFNILGHDVSLKLYREQLLKHSRMEIIEFIPSSKMLKLLAQLM
jgi:transcriptional regulator with XRE-family HTH domain